MTLAHVWIWWEDTRTGDVGFYDERGDEIGSVSMEGGEPNWVLWDEGNYGCDCNRRIFFLGDDIDIVECGEGRFNILSRGVWPTIVPHTATG